MKKYIYLLIVTIISSCGTHQSATHKDITITSEEQTDSISVSKTKSDQKHYETAFQNAAIWATIEARRIKYAKPDTNGIQYIDYIEEVKIDSGRVVSKENKSSSVINEIKTDSTVKHIEKDEHKQEIYDHQSTTKTGGFNASFLVFIMVIIAIWIVFKYIGKR